MMRAKMFIVGIEQYGHDGKVTQERLKLSCVSDRPFGPNGESEDNTFARYSPAGDLAITSANPALLGRFKPGQKFYLDFTEAAA